MNPLQNLTPDQIKALTPECLQILLGYSRNDKLEDIAKMKSYFTQLEYNHYDAYYREEDARELRKLLLKYSKDNFYLTYEEIGYGVPYLRSMNYELHTEEEINKIIPTGSDLKKLCFSGCEYKNYGTSNVEKYKERKIKFVHCPRGYDSEPTLFSHSIAQLTHYHNNLHIVHPKLIEAAKYFFDS